MTEIWIRPPLDERWMRRAEEVSVSATCRRRRVGAIIVVDGQDEASGYNGAPRGEPHCLDVGCEMLHGHCVRTVHAEMNACLQFNTNLYRGRHITLYTTASPCRACMSAILNIGARRIVYRDAYKDATHAGDASRWALEAGLRNGIDMVHLPKP